MGGKVLRSGKALSVPAGLGVSLTVNVSVALVTLVLVAYNVHKKIITWEAVGYYIMIILLVSSFLGAKIAIATTKTHPVVVAAMSGILFWSFLLGVTALFFGGRYGSVLETAALINGGSVAAVLLKLPEKKKYMKKR